VSCGSFSKKQWQIGVDANWYPLRLGDQTVAVTAFSTELLTAIGTKEDLALTRVTVNWDELMSGLQQNSYEAILTSMPPFLFNQKDFDFSERYLALGPVLVVPTGSPLHSIKELQGKEIGVLTGSSYDLLLEPSPEVIIRYYDSIPDMLNAILQRTIDGALVGNLSANAYLRDLYQHELAIATPPLTEEGLRLVAKRNQAKALIQAFNRGLHKLQDSGEYNALLTQWGLSSIPSKV
jgi:polar amino acid transport system substrate-binding protein